LSKRVSVAQGSPIPSAHLPSPGLMGKYGACHTE